MVIGQILGAGKVVSLLGVKGKEAAAVLKLEVGQLAGQLSRHVKADKLTGQVLHVQTGRLRRSITYKVETEPGSIWGLVGTNVVYARAHEFGVDKFKVVTVHEYLRRTVSSGVGTWRKKHGMSVPMATVHSFQRHQHIKLPERSFLRTALADMAPEIRVQMEQSIRKAVAL